MYQPFCTVSLRVGNKAMKCIAQTHPAELEILQMIFSEPYLVELAECLPKDEDSAAMISFLRQTLKLHKACLAKELNSETLEHVEIIDDFKTCFERVHQSAYQVPMNLKAHIIMEHLV